MFFTIFWNEKTPFQAIKKRSSKSRKIAFFSKRVNARFRSKNGHFSNFFFLGNIGQEKMVIFPSSFFFGKIGQENVFYDILERKMPFQAIKRRSSNSRKIDIFPKGLTRGFAPKMVIFPTSFLLAKLGRKMSFTIFQN